ncbi:pullulanase [Sulfitobacter sp. BDSS02]|nr:pullulanase [Sulfitobacter sp. BDSS02]MBR9849627.1 pullulanase [Paracoccaceae bacterium]
MNMYASAERRSAPYGKIPRYLLRAMFALVVCVLALVTYARLSDVPLSATPPEGAIVAKREMILSFNDLSGAVQVLNPDGSLMVDLGPEEGGFVAGVARVINRERIKNRSAPDGPVVLVRRDTGRIAITDPSTGWSADLMGFGADNARAFARLLDR